MAATTLSASSTSAAVSTHTLTASSSVDAREFSMVYVTVPSIAVAERLARGLIQHKLAACVNIVPGVQSIYEWQGKVQSDSELLLIIKTRSVLVSQLTEWVRREHPYTVCEVVSITLSSGNAPYLHWIGQTATRSPNDALPPPTADTPSRSASSPS